MGEKYMLKIISSLLSKKNQAKTIIIFSIAWVFMQIIMVVKPFGTEQINALSPGTKILELQFNYSQEIAHKTLEQLGEAGRNAYLKLILIDFIYIIIYTFFFVSCLRALVAFFKLDTTFLTKVCVLPLLCGFLDIWENIFTLIQIRTFPNETFLLFKMSNIVTMCKYVLTLLYEGITFVGFLGYLIILLKNVIFRNNSNLEKVSR
jgi:hypothetical protein